MIVPPSGAWNGRPGRQRIAHTMRTAAIPRSPPFKALRFQIRHRCVLFVRLDTGSSEIFLS